MRVRRSRADSPPPPSSPPPGWLAELDTAVIDLLATGRILCTNEQAVVERQARPVFTTVHRGPRRFPTSTHRPEPHLKHDSPRTKPSLTSRRHDRRRRNKAARAARRHNR